MKHTIGKFLDSILHHSSKGYVVLKENVVIRLVTIAVICGSIGFIIFAGVSRITPAADPIMRRSAPVQTDFQNVRTTLLLDATANSYTSGLAPSGLSQVLTLAFTDTVETVTNNSLAIYINLLRELRNYIAIDILDTLDSSTNRNVLYENYMKQLRELGVKGTEYLRNIESEISMLKGQLGTINSAKKESTNRYTEALKNYDGNSTYRYLQEVIGKQDEAARLTGNISALESVRESYKRMLSLASRKLTFMQANHDAIIKNVRVVEFKDFKNELILSENEWKNLLNN